MQNSDGIDTSNVLKDITIPEHDTNLHLVMMHRAAMENKCRSDDLMEFLDPQTILPDMPTEKVKMLLIELEMIMEDYNRDLAIVYLSSNYSSHKHLCSIILKGKHDDDVKKSAGDVKEILISELNRRKAGK